MSNEVIEVASNEEGDGRKAKRLRISRACAKCRHAKLKCDGESPTCSSCRQQNKRCSYEVSSRRRGLRSGHVRALELLWGLTFHEVENAEEVAERLLGRLSKQDLSTSTDRSDAAAPASVVLEVWKQSSVLRRLDELLDEREEHNTGLGSGSNAEDSQQIQLGTATKWSIVNKAADGPDLLNRSNHIPQHSKTEQNPSTVPQNICAARSTIPLEPPLYARELIDLCFEHVQSWLPILDRHIILKTAFQYASKPASENRGDRAALWGLYAYTSATLGHMLKDQNPRDDAQHNSSILYAQAFSMLPLDTDDAIELGHIQCAVLIALTRFVSGAYTATSRLLRLASEWMSEMAGEGKNQNTFSRLYLAIFVLETVAAAKRQGIPTTSFADIEDRCKIHEGVEEWQPWRGPYAMEAEALAPTPSDVPTRALSLLVLHARLLRYLNDRLRSQTTCLNLEKSQIHQWLDYIKRQAFDTSFTSALVGDAINYRTLPPGYVSLRIIYTALCDPAHLHTTATSGDDSYSTSDSELEPKLTLDDLKTLSTAPHAFECFPLIVLLLPSRVEQCAPGTTELIFDGAQDTVHRDYATSQGPATDGRAQAGEHQTVGEAKNMYQDISDIQQHSDRLLVSLTSGTTTLNNELPEGNDPDTGPSFDSYSFPSDAPFLDFMDDLDKRAA